MVVKLVYDKRFNPNTNGINFFLCQFRLFYLDIFSIFRLFFRFRDPVEHQYFCIDKLDRSDSFILQISLVFFLRWRPRLFCP